MKTLKESLLADVDDVLKSGDKIIKDSIKQWLKENLSKGISGCKISKKPNDKGLYEVSAKNNVVFKNKITSLTNDSFIWTEIHGDFLCNDCYSLKSLEGAPYTVGGDFSCSYCNSLTSLKGAPDFVYGDFRCVCCSYLESLEGAPEHVNSFYCGSCNKLKSLKGCPKKIEGFLDCINCINLTSLEGCSEEVGSIRLNYTNLKNLHNAPKKVKYGFSCSYNDNLISLEGCPKEIGGNFSITNCKNLNVFDDCPKIVGQDFYFEFNGYKITKDQITSKCKVQRNIFNNGKVII